MSRRKITAIEKIEAAKAYAEGRCSQADAAKRLRVKEASVQMWIAHYKAGGPTALQSKEHNKVYPAELKALAVQEYLSGNGSLVEISAKFGICSKSRLREWIKVYNSGKDFGHKMSGGSRMKQGRGTTWEERIAIAKDCLESGENFGETAIKYNVSYQHVYTWVKKFKAQGEAGLEDRRGKKVAQQEPRTELEKVQIELAQLKHKLYMTEMERDLLKKLDELERRDAFRK